MLDRSTSSRSHVDIDMVLAELVEDSERIVDEITGLAVILPQDTVETGVRITVISTAGAKVTVRTQGYGGMLLPAIEVVTENPRLLFEAQEGFFLPGLGRMPLSGTGKLARLGHDYQPVYVVQGNPTREVLDCIFRELGQATLVFVPLETTAGRVQVTGRMVEDALFQIRDAQIPLDNVKFAAGIAPLVSHLNPDEIIMHLSDVYLEGDLKGSLAERVALPKQYRGKRFRELTDGKGFSQIDRRVFSPARVTVSSPNGISVAGFLEEEVIQWQRAL
jgi:methenyltetrahydromethanopterin cyclohydrolase